MRVLVAAGASGGHLFPALSFLEELSQQYPDAECCLVVPRDRRSLCVKVSGCRIEYLDIAPVSLRLTRRNIRAWVLFFRGAAQGARILAREKPDVVVGFGSYATCAVMFLAWAMRIKTVVHEQNVIPGKATRMLAPLVDSICLSFSQSRKYLRTYECRICITGNPLRRSLSPHPKEAARAVLGLDPGVFTLLVMGGSQGSAAINRACIEYCGSRKADAPLLQVVHLAGAADASAVQEAYRKAKVKARVFDFFDQMEFAYSASDLTIARAGASCVCELALFGVPAVLIPYPHAHRHQYANALVLKEEGCAVIIDNDKVDAGLLQRTVDDLISHPEKLQRMRSCFVQAKGPCASSMLVHEVMRG